MHIIPSTWTDADETPADLWPVDLDAPIDLWPADVTSPAAVR